MTTSTHIDQIILSLAPDRSVRGINVYAVATFLDDAGQPTGAAPMPPRDATLEDITGLLAPSLVVQQQQIAGLTADFGTARLTYNDLLAANERNRIAVEETFAAKEARIEELEAQLAAATAPAPSVDLLSNLNTAFAEAVPEAMRPAFAGAYAIVRVLVQAGQVGMARGVIENTPVPPELAAAKTKLLAALTAV